MSARTSGRRCTPSSRRHRACAMSRSLYAIRSPFVRDPAPLVTRWRSRTVANGGSITFDVRRCFQCSAGKSKNVSSTSASFSSVVTAFGYFGPYSVANCCAASRASSRVSAYITSCSAAFTRGWRRFGSLSRMFPSLWNQSRCSRVFGHTSRTAAQKPRAPSPTATTGGRMPRRFRSRSTVFQLSALSR